MRGFEYFVNLLYTIPMTLKKKQKIYKRDTKPYSSINNAV